MRPLHHAVMMNQPDMARLLLKHGADIHARSQQGYTPLHQAAIRGYDTIAELLIENGADINAADDQGRTPVDWAALEEDEALVELLVARGATRPEGLQKQVARQRKTKKTGRRVSVGPQILGRILDGTGKPMDGLDAFDGEATQPVFRAMDNPAPAIFETGIKIVDLFAPLKRGGHNGSFSPLAGAGHLVLLSQIMYSMAALHDGYVVFLGLEEGGFTAESLLMAWRGEFGFKDKMLNERMVHLFGQAGDPPPQHYHLVETGLTIAEDFRRQGHDVLLVVGSKLAQYPDVVRFLKTSLPVTPEAAITVLYDGKFTVGLEPVHLTKLDAVVTLDGGRARARLYPAVDPLRATSTLLQQPELIGQAHIDLVSEAQNLFRRYHELHSQVEHRGLDGLFYLDDRKDDERIAIRARRLHRFLTQPFFGIELWTGLLGQHVSLAETIRGCRAILDGVL